MRAAFRMLRPLAALAFALVVLEGCAGPDDVDQGEVSKSHADLRVVLTMDRASYGADQAVVCNQILQKLNEGNIPQSLMVTKVTTGPHNGGTINNAANWTADFVNNKAVFF